MHDDKKSGNEIKVWIHKTVGYFSLTQIYCALAVTYYVNKQNEGTKKECEWLMKRRENENRIEGMKREKGYKKRRNRRMKNEEEYMRKKCLETGVIGKMQNYDT